MEDRRFDELTRRVGALALPRLPRRGLLGLLGGAVLAGTLGPRSASAAKCKDEGQKCDKKKCKKKGKKCCCEGKCKNDRCKDRSPSCPTSASFNKQWSSFDGGDTFLSPWGIATDPDGNVYVTDRSNDRVLVFNQNGTALLDEFGEDGEGSNNFKDARGIGINQNNNGNDRLYVADPGQDDNDDRIRRFDGNLSGDFGNRLASLGDDTGVDPSFPYGVATDASDRIWIVNRENPGQVFLINQDGGFVTTFTPNFTSPGDDFLDDPEGITAYEDDNGNTFVFVADTGNNRIVKFRYVSNDEEDGLQYVTEVGRADGNFGDGNKEFDRPTGLAVDDCGNVWVADLRNDRVQVFDRNLEDLIDSIENSNFLEPTGVALSPEDDALYVASSENDRVVKFDLS